MMAPTIVHPEAVAILEHALESASVALPGSVGSKHDVTANRPMQFKPHAIEPFNQVPVDQQLAPRADVDDLGGFGGPDSGRRERDGRGGQTDPSRQLQPAAS